MPAVAKKKSTANKKKQDYVAKKQGFDTVQKTISRPQKNGRRKTFQCSIGKDEKGYFAYTHRARSKSYPSKDKIPVSVLNSISSTG